MRQEFITNHMVVHGTAPDNVTEYPTGSTLTFDTETDAEVIRALRAAHAIALPNELRSAEETADQLARLEAERNALLAELERLHGEQQAAAEHASSEQQSAPPTSRRTGPSASASK